MHKKYSSLSHYVFARCVCGVPDMAVLRRDFAQEMDAGHIEYLKNRIKDDCENYFNDLAKTKAYTPEIFEIFDVLKISRPASMRESYDRILALLP